MIGLEKDYNVGVNISPLSAIAAPVNIGKPQQDVVNNLEAIEIMLQIAWF